MREGKKTHDHVALEVREDGEGAAAGRNGAHERYETATVNGVLEGRERRVTHA